MILVTLSRTWFAVVSCLESRFLPSVSKLTYDFLWKTFTCINQFHPSDNSVSGRQLDSTSLFLSSLLSGPTSHFFCLLNMQSSVPRSSLCTWCSSYTWCDLTVKLTKLPPSHCTGPSSNVIFTDHFPPCQLTSPSLFSLVHFTHGTWCQPVFFILVCVFSPKR